MYICTIIESGNGQNFEVGDTWVKWFRASKVWLYATVLAGVQGKFPSLTTIITYLFPLCEIPQEPNQLEQPQQTEELDETQHSKCSRRTKPLLYVERMCDGHGDVVKREYRQNIQYNPLLQVELPDGFQVQDDSVITCDGPRPEIEDNVNNEKEIGYGIESYPSRFDVVFEEGYSHW